MKILFSLVTLILILPAFTLPAQESGPGILRIGGMVGMVVDPYLSGIEQVHAAAAGFFGYQRRLGVSLRPTFLFNSRSVFFRVPLFIEIPLFENRLRCSQNEPSLSISVVGGGGIGTWDGAAEGELKPLLSGGVDLSFCSLLVSGLITAVVRANGLDLLADLFVGCLWGL